ncbi:MAG TPA: glycogen synthase GlgA [Oxalicibacterium sp.]|nr:glycogen synthase GlgA [Oxalicibacterium sp.]
MPQPSVLLVTSEAVPLVKTGGLADVIGALAASLSTSHVDVTILIPGYPSAVRNAFGLKKIADLPALPGGDAELFLGTMPDSRVKVLLLRSPLFDRRTANPYIDHSGHELDDNAIAFASLAHAAVRICAGRANYPVPHVVQANDWHAGLIAALLKLENITDVGSVMTIHNLAFQGNYPVEIAPQIGIPQEMITEDGMEFWGKMSYLKAGIAWSDCITTVSKTYAKEILTERFGYGMQDMLNRRRHVLHAIPNAVDLDVWHPETDKLIKRNFSVDNLAGKAACKRDLQKQFGLPIQQFTPLMAIGSRITHQKMADLILAAMPRILHEHPHLQIAVLGCGEPQYEEQFRQLAEQHPDRIGVYIGYDERRAHALHAGADILLHPTRFEPFGLTPLYSMLYGTVPVASRVGGLCDTIVDAGRDYLPVSEANGILFDGEETDDLVEAIAHALHLYMRPAAWQSMQRHAMQGNYSWSGPAAQYIQLYAKIAPLPARQLFLDLLKPRASKLPAVINPSHYKLIA